MANSKVRCKGCRKYVAQDSTFVRGLSRFCSDDCYHRSLQKTPRVKKMATKSKIHSSLNGPSDQVRKRALQRDRFRCRLCGGSNNLVPHHVYYRSEAKKEPWLNQTHNLITLCNTPCHLSIIHGNKKKYQPILLGLIWLSEIENQYMTIAQFEKRFINE